MAQNEYNQAFKRLMGYTKRYKAAIILAIIGMLGSAYADVKFIASIKIFVDEGLNKKDVEVYAMAPFFIIGIFVIRGIFNFMTTYFLNWVGTNVVLLLRKELFGRLIRLPVSYHDQTSAGTLISKLTFDTEQIQMASSKALVVMVREGAFVIGMIGYMIYESWQLSLIFLLLSPIIAVIVSYVTKRFRHISHSIQTSMGDVTKSAEQTIRGHKVILGFGGQDIENERFAKVNNTNRQQKMKMETTRAISVSLIQIIASFALAAVFYLATIPEVIASLSPGSFMAIVAGMMMLLRPLKQLTTVNSEFQRGMAACVSVFDVIDEKEETDTGTFKPQTIKGDIELKNVTFTYPTKDKPIFDGIDLTIEAGKTVALVGGTGSGKSTISNLLPRYYNIDSGTITLDGKDIREYDLKSLRKQFAVVSQNVILFNDTIANNIAYGYEGEVTRERIIEVSKQAHVMEFVENMTDGLDSMVGENGVMLSGGQRQRIAIARALLRDAPILILDEATSALDTKSEKVIQTALDELQKNRTNIVIAHRLSTIENADKIVVVDHGKIIEQGTHDELIATKGAYESLYQLQFRENK